MCVCVLYHGDNPLIYEGQQLLYSETLKLRVQTNTAFEADLLVLIVTLF